MKTIDHSFREKLNKVLGGFAHNYCYQCGACVPDCPSHRYLPQFNPRTIILNALFGFEEDLIGPESLIWNCTNCYNCHERCPQEVSPIEVIIALKNMAMEKGTNPPVINNIVERVKKHGLTVAQTDLTTKRRAELNLPPFQLDCMDELEKLFNPKESNTHTRSNKS
jgi:heterodisulfide reductase subunit C